MFQKRKQKSDGTWDAYATHANVTTPGYTFGAREVPEGIWQFRVRANTTGVGSSPWTGSQQVEIEYRPAQPAWISSPATDNDGTYIVDWPAVSGAQRYELQLAYASGGPWTLRYSGTATQTQDAHTNGTYYYQVRACKSFACSAYRGVAQTTVYIGGGPCPLNLTTSSTAGTTGEGTTTDGATAPDTPQDSSGTGTEAGTSSSPDATAQLQPGC